MIHKCPVVKTFCFRTLWCALTGLMGSKCALEGGLGHPDHRTATKAAVGSGGLGNRYSSLQAKAARHWVVG